tara:strand:- start:1581 stop:2570 length:990 start_codon:yes stop_codon:yes gene_type:complete
MEVNLNDVRDNPFNTREDYGDLSGLIGSIKKYGVVQSFPARKVGGKYEVAFGSRRLKAMKEAGITKVEVDEQKISNEDMTMLSLFENIHRKDLSSIELARAYNVGLKVSGLSVKEFASNVGASESSVRDYLSVLTLPKRILDKQEDYNLQELMSIARMRNISRTVGIELEEELKITHLPAIFLGEITKACSRIYASNLPERKKVELSGRVVHEDYSKLSSERHREISEFATHILREEQVRHDVRLKKTEKAREVLKKKKIEHIEQIPNPSRNVDRVTDLLQAADYRVSKLISRDDYKKASKKSKNRFNSWAQKVVSRLEDILDEKKEQE